MKNQRSRIVVFLFLMCAFFTNAQNAKFGINASAGMSWQNISLEIENEIGPSGKVGFFYERKINEKWGVRTGLFLDYLKNKDKVTYEDGLISEQQLGGDLGIIEEPMNDPVLEGGSQLFTIERENDFLYTSLPVSIFYKIKRVSFAGGFQLMYLCFGETKNKFGFGSKEHFPNWDYGLTAGVELKVSNKINIVSNFYLGLNNLLGEASIYERKNRQATLGLNYYLTK